MLLEGIVQGDAREDREWEHWPGRKPPDDRIRQRLRALFSATDDGDAIDAMISDRGREIEQQTERLQLTIDDLERREEQAARLRSAVEEMLRHGSAELDERHAALTALAQELGAREEQMREQERDIALRRQELGAVELRRAAVEQREEAAEQREEAAEQREEAAERREEAAAEREAALDLAAAELEARGSQPAASEPEPAAGHILVLVDNGWRIVEREGRVPALDNPVEVDGKAFVVSRVGLSVLPGDRRACAYLEPARHAPQE
jgi:DNA repair exonuclease SbcCD ATPase subunit